MKSFKLIAALICLPIALLMLVMLASMGGASPAAAVPIEPPATEDKMWQYAEYSSMLGVPWDIALIADAVVSFDNELFSLEERNPLDTILHFSVILEEEWHWEIVGWETNEDGSESPIYDWVFYGINQYIGKQAIMNYAKWSVIKPEYSYQTLFDDVKAAEQAKCSADVKYIAYFSVNTDYRNILQNSLFILPENVTKIMDLYNAGYADRWFSEEKLAQIEQMLPDFGLKQRNHTFEAPTLSQLDGLVYTNGATEVTYFAQNDPRWANAAYGSDNIGEYGCGPTSMAMVISSLTENNVTPVDMAQWACDNGYYLRGGGSAHALIPAAATGFGLEVQGCTADEPQRIVDALSSGKLVVSIMGAGTFTNSGHFIVLRGVTESGNILVADPISTKKTEKEWDLELILNESKDTATAGGPFWIIG